MTDPNLNNDTAENPADTVQKTRKKRAPLIPDGVRVAGILHPGQIEKLRDIYPPAEGKAFKVSTALRYAVFDAIELDHIRRIAEEENS